MGRVRKGLRASSSERHFPHIAAFDPSVRRPAPNMDQSAGA
ncbi:hypothetical protein F750_3455 [Streptomyces sp. PAMC 26508]|nr:hypothetical protein F750_3455 [Streptomyces sp. PAMC 26508]